MTRDGMTIGQLAKAAGVGVETIRFYERLGLLDQPRALNGGWRRYDRMALVRLQYIRHAKTLDLSLKDIATLQRRLGDGPAFCAAVRQAVASKLERLETEMAAMRRLESELKAFLGACQARSHGASCPTIDALSGRTLAAAE